jgi:hypothetical protein
MRHRVASQNRRNKLRGFERLESRELLATFAFFFTGNNAPAAGSGMEEFRASIDADSRLDGITLRRSTVGLRAPLAQTNSMRHAPSFEFPDPAKRNFHRSDHSGWTQLRRLLVLQAAARRWRLIIPLRR